MLFLAKFTVSRYTAQQAHRQPVSVEQRATHTEHTTCCHSTKLIKRSKSVRVLNCNFSNEQSVLPEDDRMIETCRSVLSVLM
jgi:hypothetical protein